jgi:hypothetical protein
MANQGKESGVAQYIKPAVVYKGVFESPLGSPLGGSPDDFEIEYRAERDSGANWLRSFTDLFRAK